MCIVALPSIFMLKSVAEYLWGRIKTTKFALGIN